MTLHTVSNIRPSVFSEACPLDKTAAEAFHKGFQADRHLEHHRIGKPMTQLSPRKGDVLIGENEEALLVLCPRPKVAHPLRGDLDGKFLSRTVNGELSIKTLRDGQLDSLLITDQIRRNGQGPDHFINQQVEFDNGECPLDVLAFDLGAPVLSNLVLRNAQELLDYPLQTLEKHEFYAVNFDAKEGVITTLQALSSNVRRNGRAVIRVESAFTPGMQRYELVKPSMHCPPHSLQTQALVGATTVASYLSNALCMLDTLAVIEGHKPKYIFNRLPEYR